MVGLYLAFSTNKLSRSRIVTILNYEIKLSSAFDDLLNTAADKSLQFDDRKEAFELIEKMVEFEIKKSVQCKNCAECLL